MRRKHFFIQINLSQNYWKYEWILKSSRLGYLPNQYFSEQNIFFFCEVGRVENFAMFRILRFQ